MPEFEIAWQIHLSKNSPGPLAPPNESDLAAAYPSIVERLPLISVTTDGGRTGVIHISQRTSAGDARTAAMYIRSGNPFASDAGITYILGDETIDAAVSGLTVTNTESGVIESHDSGQYRPDDSDSKPPARRTRRRARPAIAAAEVEEPEAEEPEAEEPEAEDDIEGVGV